MAACSAPQGCAARPRAKLGASLAAHGQTDEGWRPRQPQSFASRDATAITGLLVVQTGNQVGVTRPQTRQEERPPQRPVLVSGQPASSARTSGRATPGFPGGKAQGEACPLRDR